MWSLQCRDEGQEMYGTPDCDFHKMATAPDTKLTLMMLQTARIFSRMMFRRLLRVCGCCAGALCAGAFLSFLL